MERLKDFLYDMSDVLISLIIVAVIFYVVSWKLNESMPVEFHFGEEPVAGAEDPNTPPPITQANDDTENRPVEETPGSENPSTETPITTTPQAETPPTTAAPVVTPPSQVQKISVTIPSGATGFAIAKALKDKGLIKDVNAFIKHVEDLELGNKLTAGTFSLSTDMTEEQIIKKIANVK